MFKYIFFLNFTFLWKKGKIPLIQTIFLVGERIVIIYKRNILIGSQAMKVILQTACTVSPIASDSTYVYIYIYVDYWY